jgi:hypothetical protein
MHRANIAKISLLIFIIEPSIWRLRHAIQKIYINNNLAYNTNSVHSNRSSYELA